MSSPGARRRCAISANSSRSMSFAVSCSCSSGLRRPNITDTCRPIDVVVASRSRSSTRRRSSRVPNTARRITSSVIACMLGWTANARALGPAVELAAR